MEIVSRKTTQERVVLYHDNGVFSVDYDIILGENNVYQNINGTVKELETGLIVGYITKSYELTIRVVNGKEGLISDISVFAAETLLLLDEVIKNN